MQKREERGIDVRKVRSDKKVNVNPALDQHTHVKLKKLALACDKTKTMMAAELIEFCLNNPSIINWFQDRCGADEYRVVPVVENGKVYL